MLRGNLALESRSSIYTIRKVARLGGVALSPKESQNASEFDTQPYLQIDVGNPLCSYCILDVLASSPSYKGG